MGSSKSLILSCALFDGYISATLASELARLETRHQVREDQCESSRAAYLLFSPLSVVIISCGMLVQTFISPFTVVLATSITTQLLLFINDLNFKWEGPPLPMCDAR